MNLIADDFYLNLIEAYLGDLKIFKEYDSNVNEACLFLVNHFNLFIPYLFHHLSYLIHLLQLMPNMIISTETLFVK